MNIGFQIVKEMGLSDSMWQKKTTHGQALRTGQIDKTAKGYLWFYY